MLQMIVAVAAAVPTVCAAITAVLNLRKRSGRADPDQVWTGQPRPQPPPLPTRPSVAPGWYAGQAQPANTWDSVRSAPRAPSSLPSSTGNRWWQPGERHVVAQVAQQRGRP